MQLTIKSTHILNLRDDWQNVYGFKDENKAVTVLIPGKAGSPLIKGNPNTVPPTSDIPAVVKCDTFQFILWQGAAYDAAGDYTSASLITAITAYLNTLSTSAPTNISNL